MNICFLVQLTDESDKFFPDKWISLIAVVCVIVLIIFGRSALDFPHSSFQMMGWVVENDGRFPGAVLKKFATPVNSQPSSFCSKTRRKIVKTM